MFINIWPMMKRHHSTVKGVIKNVTSVCFMFTGYIGIVKDSTDSTARIELHSSCKTISVDKSRLSSLTYVYTKLSLKLLWVVV